MMILSMCTTRSGSAVMKLRAELMIAARPIAGLLSLILNEPKGEKSAAMLAEF